MKTLLATTEFFALALLNPISMAVSFLVFLVMHVYEDAGSNTLVFDRRFFPLWLLVGAVTLVVEWLFLCGFLGARPSRRPVNMVGVFRAFFAAQRPFVLMAPVFLLLSGQIEGNVFGFIIFPAYGALAILSGVWVMWRLLVGLRTVPALEADGRIRFVLPAVVTLAILIWTAAEIWGHGPENEFGLFLAWRADTPQYAVVQIAAALQDGDTQTLASFVDLDRISAQFASIGGPDKNALLAAIANRQFYDPDRKTFGYREWHDSMGTSPLESLSRIQPKKGAPCEFTAAAFVVSAVTGEFHSISWLLTKTDDGYRITAVDNWQQIEDDVKKIDLFRQSLPNIQAEAEKEAQEIVAFELLPGVAADWIVVTEDEQNGSLRLPLRLTNRGSKPIERIKFFASLQDSETKETRLVLAVWTDVKEPLAPGEVAEAKGDTMLAPNACRGFSQGRLVLGKVFPVIVVFSNGISVELTKSADDFP